MSISILNICIKSLVGTNYLLIDSNAVIKDNFIENAAQKGCSAILFKKYSEFDSIKKENINKYLKINLHKKMKIIFIDEFVESISDTKKVSEENILSMPDFLNNKDLIPDFSLALLNFYLSMNKHIGYKEFEISALNSLRISKNIENIDVLDSIVFNLIKLSEGQKISSEDVESYLQGFNIKQENKNNVQEISFNFSETIFNQRSKGRV